MTQNNKEKFLDRVRKEIEAIKRCSSNSGFIERISSRFLPMLREDVVSSELVRKWEITIKQDKDELEVLAIKGCEELTMAFKDLWCELVSRPKANLREGKMGIVACRINEVSAARFLVNIMKIVCEGGVCCYVEYPMKIAYELLKNMYCERIAKSWDFRFAPNAYRYLEITSLREIAARVESVPHSAWEFLVILAKAWSLRGKQLRVGGGRVRGKKETRIYRAHQADLEARFNYFAEDLKKCSVMDGQLQIFKRQFYHNILDNLVFEIEIALRKTNPVIDTISQDGDIHASTLKYREDMEILIPQCEEIIHGKGCKIKNQQLIVMIQRLIDDGEIQLNDPTPTRIEEAVRQARAKAKGIPRIVKSRRKDGAPNKTPKKSSQNLKRSPKC